jgi:hypothetical protein
MVPRIAMMKALLRPEPEAAPRRQLAKAHKIVR